MYELREVHARTSTEECSGDAPLVVDYIFPANYLTSIKQFEALEQFLVALSGLANR